ncbi:MAG: preprotein translocase subunit SecE [Planctomycetes bacterium]|nr:preprotein translocase subunit SecE [Planctomycetota bacterium]
MYKWPQGRVIRTICLILALVVAADLGYTGAFAKISASLGPENAQAHLRQLILGIFFTVASLSAIIAGLVAAGFNHKSVDFLIEVEQEMVRVEWPKPNTLVRSTLVIAVAIAILAGVIFLSDFILLNLLNYLLSLGDRF